MMGQREEAKKKIILVRESQSVLGPDGGFGIFIASHCEGFV